MLLCKSKEENGGRMETKKVKDSSIKLWHKSSSIKQSMDFEAFMFQDIDAEQKLVKYECKASKAHARMLHKIGILTSEELNQIIEVLDEIIILDDKSDFVLKQSDEDVHTKVELYLTNKLGEIGKKIHTYRSRNEQIFLE